MDTSNLQASVQTIRHLPVVTQNGQVKHTTQVTIMVGTYGPFTRSFDDGQDTPEQINAWKMQKVTEVKAIVG